MISKHVLFLLLSLLVCLVDKDFIFEYFHWTKEKKAEARLLRYDYAALESGGKVLESSHQIFGVKGILREDKDKYLLVPCLIPEKWVEISLLEYILIDEVQFIQGEIYSSAFKEIEIFYSTNYPSDSWILLANVTLLQILQPQRFRVHNKWVRFLKIVFKSHYGNEHYCTLTQFSVYGSNILQELDDEYYRARKEEMTDLLEGIKDLNLPENNLKNVFKKQTEQLRQIELFYDDFAMDEEEVCVDRFNFEYTFNHENFTGIDSIQSGIKNGQVDIFQAMIKHMAKTDAYLTLYDSYFLFLLEVFNSNSVEDRETRGKLENLSMRIKKEKIFTGKMIKLLQEDTNRLDSQVKSLNFTLLQVKRLYNNSERSIQNLQLWVYLLGFFNVISLSILLLKSMNFSHIDCKDSEVQIGNARIKRAKTISSRTTPFEERFVRNVSRPAPKSKLHNH